MEPLHEEPEGSGLSRAGFLKKAGLVGVAATVPAGLVGQHEAHAHAERRQLEAFSATEAETVDAFVSRLIPTDDLGPGAHEAKVVNFIDRSLAGWRNDLKETYSNAIIAIDDYSERRFGAAFARLTPQQQDAVVAAVQSNQVTGIAPNSGTFFTMIRTHAIEGMFADPYYGGNANFVGWNLVRYPGPKIMVTQQQQRLGVTIAPTRKSAYDHEMFHKQSAKKGK